MGAGVSTIKEDINQLQMDIRNLNSRLIAVEKRLEVLIWLLGIGTAIITAIAADVAKRLLMP